MTTPPAIHDLAEELCDPHHHHAVIHDWVNRNRKTRTHTTTQQGLLAQMAELYVAGGNPDSDHAHPASKPPARWDALATHTTITIAAARWCHTLRLPQRNTVEGNIRALIGAWPTLDPDDRDQLHRDVARWHRQAEIVTGWQTPPMDPRAPCPALIDGQHECGRRALRINITEQQAFCGACGTEWRDGQLAALGETIRAYHQAAADARQRARKPVQPATTPATT